MQRYFTESFLFLQHITLLANLILLLLTRTRFEMHTFDIGKQKLHYTLFKMEPMMQIECVRLFGPYGMILVIKEETLKQ